jgi:DNA modification methylase
MLTLYHGDCVDILPTLPANSIDAVCTDPPYHLTSITKRFGSSTAIPAQHQLFARTSTGFMGKTCYGGDIAFRPETWAAMLRTMKPG